MAELADVQAAENTEIIQGTPSDTPAPVIGKVEEPKKLSLREELQKNFKEAEAPEVKKAAPNEDRPRDKDGRFIPVENGDKPLEAAPEVQKTKEEAPPEAPKVIGPPPGWSPEAKAFYNSLPADHPIRKDVAKREEEVSNGFKSKSDELTKYRGIDEALAPLMPILQQSGLKTYAEGVQRLVQWESALRNPATRQQAFQNLAAQLGFNLNQPQGSPPSQQDNALKPVLDQFGNLQQEVSGVRSELQRLQESRISTELSTFAKDKPHFEKVRITMGQLMSAGMASDLDTAYQKAVALDPEVQSQIKAEEEAKRSAESPRAKAKAAISPSTRAPTAPMIQKQEGKGVRGAILKSIEEVRANGRA